MNKLQVIYNGRDISDEIEAKRGKSNLCGWSQMEIWHKDKQIGWLESGYPMDFEKGYTAQVIEIEQTK